MALFRNDLTSSDEWYDLKLDYSEIIEYAYENEMRRPQIMSVNLDLDYQESYSVYKILTRELNEVGCNITEYWVNDKSHWYRLHSIKSYLVFKVQHQSSKSVAYMIHGREVSHDKWLQYQLCLNIDKILA